MENQEFNKFFKAFGKRCKELRVKKKLTQEDMMQFGFATRHYQRIEQGLQVNMVTVLKLGKAFGVKISTLLKGLD